MTTPLNQRLTEVILEAYRHGFSIQSNFSREKAELVGMAASMGLITTRICSNVYSREWRPTITGLQFLNDLDEDALPYFDVDDDEDDDTDPTQH